MATASRCRRSLVRSSDSWRPWSDRCAAEELSLPLLPVVLPLLSSILLTSALNRSSWARSALRTCQTTLNRLLSARAFSGAIPAGSRRAG